MRILIAEDEHELRHIIAQRLRGKGYSVDACADGESALEYMRGAEYECVVMDIMMPRMSGLEVTLQARAEGINCPVLLLTALSEVEDRVDGLDAGADDYLTKPFVFDELLARVRALMRRLKQDKSNVLNIADLVVDTKAKKTYRGGQELELATKEYAILECLARHQGQVLSRNQIADYAWNYDFDCESNIIDVYIRYLRAKLDEGYEIKLIKTVRNQGYMIKA